MKKTLGYSVIGLSVIVAGFFLFQLLFPLSGEKKEVQAENYKSESAVSRVARELSPSVVGIISIGEEGDFFTRRPVEKSGSGVVIDAGGTIVTNNHVVENADRYLVVLPSGDKKEAKLLGRDRRTDLAVLKLNGVKIKPAHFGDSSKLVVGEGVVAIGNPLGVRFARSVTSGIVSGLNRLLTTEEGFVFKLIQTDAAINPGNSGGALANLNGEVVGINTIKIAVPGFEGMGFAIPANQAKNVVAELIAKGKVTRPVAGLKVVKEVTPADAQYYNLPVDYGVAVVPTKDGAARKAGLKEYDIIQGVNDHRITSASELQSCMFNCSVGDSITFKVVRIPRNGGKLTRFTQKVKLDGDQ